MKKLLVRDIKQMKVRLDSLFQVDSNLEAVKSLLQTCGLENTIEDVTNVEQFKKDLQKKPKRGKKNG